MAGRRTFRILTYSQQSGILINRITLMYNEQTNAHLTDSFITLFFIYRCYMSQRQHVTLSEL